MVQVLEVLPGRCRDGADLIGRGRQGSAPVQLLEGRVLSKGTHRAQRTDRRRVPNHFSTAAGPSYNSFGPGEPPNSVRAPCHRGALNNRPSSPQTTSGPPRSCLRVPLRVPHCRLFGQRCPLALPKLLSTLARAVRPRGPHLRPRPAATAFALADSLFPWCITLELVHAMEAGTEPL